MYGRYLSVNTMNFFERLEDILWYIEVIKIAQGNMAVEVAQMFRIFI